MASLGYRNIELGGKKFVLHRVAYRGSSTTFNTDQTAAAATTVWPASGGPTVTVGTPSAGIVTLTVAANGTHDNGSIWVLIAHNTTVASSKIAV